MIFNVGSGNAGNLVHLHVSYDPSLAGTTITATNGSEVHTAKANESGLTVISGFKLGGWTVSEDKFGTSVVVNTVYYGNYELSVGGDLVHLILTYDEELIGATVTVSNGSEKYTKTADGSKRISIYSKLLGTWTINVVKGEDSGTQSINVGTYGEYTLEIATEAVTLNIITEDEELKSATVKIYKGNDTTGELLKTVTLINGFYSVKLSKTKIGTLPCDLYVYEESNNVGTNVTATAYKEYTVEMMTEVFFIQDGEILDKDAWKYKNSSYVMRFTKKDETLEFMCASTGHSYYYREVDVTNYSKFILKNAYTLDTLRNDMGVLLNAGTTEYTAAPTLTREATDYEIDVSGLTGIYYLQLHASNQNNAGVQSISFK